MNKERNMEAILSNFEQGIKDGLAKARKANTLDPLVVIFPAQCKCGHFFLERYMLQQERADGCVAFCWCGFCRTRRDVFKHNAPVHLRAVASRGEADCPAGNGESL